MKWNCQFGACVCASDATAGRRPARRERRHSVTWETVTILMLVTFILGLFMGASLVRPKG